ncbi:oligosaccharide flippase family protein [Marinobacter sp. CA1]|uniref:oligosaccharide flippase family protein n=1 Tax=Marinobacter sp. CA1 TaxID=2817656 RepID=UPI001D098122|nr:oligosaccharide flippase family protein [Marinobacter sp. CA1]UDL03849.1 oligosaccharide flippase family protein [Marinobacter sp. CA1]
MNGNFRLSDFFRKSFTNLGRQLLEGGLQLLTIVLIARVYGPEGSGTLAMALLVPQLLTSFLNLGLGSANVYYISSGRVSVQNAWQLTKKIYFILVFLGCVFQVVPLLFFDYLLRGIDYEYLVFSIFLFPLMLFVSFVSSFLQGAQLFNRLNVILLVSPAVAFFSLSIFHFLFESNFLVVLFIYFSSFSISSLLGLVMIADLMRSSRKCTKSQHSLAYRKNLLFYGLKSHLSSIVTFLNYKIDLLLIGFFLGALEAGLYVVAVQIGERLWMISQSSGTILLPTLSSLDEFEKGRRDITVTVSCWVFVLTLLCAVALIALGYPFITLVFGEEYAVSYLILLLLIPGIIFGAPSRVIANDIASRGKPEYNLYVSLAALVMNVLGNVMLIPELGVHGAAIATSFTYSVTFIMRYFLYCRFEKVSVLRLLVPSKLEVRKVVAKLKSIIYPKI